MKINNDTQLVHRFFGDEEEFNENTRFYNLMKKAIADVAVHGRTSIFLYNNGVSVCLERKEFNEFNMTISDPSFYQYKEDNQTKLSLDRVFYYLDYIANSKAKHDSNSS